jgi:hypothetical protein
MQFFICLWKDLLRKKGKQMSETFIFRRTANHLVMISQRCRWVCRLRSSEFLHFQSCWDFIHVAHMYVEFFNETYVHMYVFQWMLFPTSNINKIEFDDCDCFVSVFRACPRLIHFPISFTKFCDAIHQFLFKFKV